MKYLLDNQIVDTYLPNESGSIVSGRVVSF